MPGKSKLIRELEMRLTLVEKDYKRGLKSSQKATDTFAQKVGKKFQGIRNQWLGISVAIGVTTAAIVKAIGPATQLEATMARLEVVAQGNVKRFGEYQQVLDANAGGLFKRSDIAAAIQYGEAVGFNFENTKKLLPLLRDVAATYNEDMRLALMAVVRASKFGEAELAERFGLTLRENAILEVTHRLFGKRLRDLTDEQKQVAVVTAAMEQLMRIRGGEERATQTMTGATKNLTTALSELAADGLTPVLSPLTKLFNIMANAARAAQSLFANMNKVTSTGVSISEIISAGLGTGITGQIAALQKLVDERNRKLIEGDTVFDFPSGPPTGAELFQREQAAIEERRKRMVEAAAAPAKELARLSEQFAFADADPLQLSIDRDAEIEARAKKHADIRAKHEATFAIKAIDINESMSQKIAENAHMVADAEEEAARRRIATVERHRAAATFGVNAIADASATLFAGLISGEVDTAKKRKALVASAAKGFVASSLGAISMVAKQEAILAAMRGLEAAAWFAGPFGAAGHFKAAAGLAALAGVTSVAAGALQASADREFEAATRGASAPPGSATGASTGRGTGNASRAITAAVNRGVQNLTIVSNISIDGNVFAGESGIEALWTEFLQQRIAQAFRTRELEAIA